MDEKRRFKRLDLDVKIETSRIDEGAATTIRMVDVKVTDISREGIGFISPEKMEVGAIYNAELKIWTKETLHSIFKIVREKDVDGGHSYGAIFVGMNESDALKIQIYEMLEERDKT